MFKILVKFKRLFCRSSYILMFKPLKVMLRFKTLNFICIRKNYIKGLCLATKLLSHDKVSNSTLKNSIFVFYIRE